MAHPRHVPDAGRGRHRRHRRPDPVRDPAGQHPPPAPQAPTVAGTATVSGAAARDGIVGGDLYASWPALVDPDSGIASFHVYVDDDLVGTVPGTTFGSYLPTPSAGVHRVRVDATNNAGLTSSSAESSFHVEPAPSAPAAPAVTATSQGWHLGGDLTLDWAAVPDADVTGYEIVVDATPVDVVGADTTHYRLGILESGYHSVRVVAVNALGLGSTSAMADFWFDATAAPAPAAPSVTAAAQYQGILRGTLRVNWPFVIDNESGTASYRVFLDDVPVASALNAGHPVSVSAPRTGVHRVRVDAVNGAGLTSAGATTTIRVDNSGPALAPPTIALRPGAAAGGTPVTITAAAVDADAGVCSVGTTVDGRLVGTTSRVNTTLPASGRATVRVTATDCLGNVTTVTRTSPRPPWRRRRRGTRAVGARGRPARTPAAPSGSPGAPARRRRTRSPARRSRGPGPARRPPAP
ncbi:hypothetical protein ACFQX7_01010 [Luedemannella flava]